MMKRWLRGTALQAVALSLSFAALISGCSSTRHDSTNAADGSGDKAHGPAGSSPLNAMLPKEIRSSGAVRVASTFGYPPNEFYEADNKTPTGISVDLGNALGKALGVRFVFSNVSFDSIIPGLIAERFDTAITAMSITPDRLKQLNMLAYQNTGAALMVADGNPKHVSDLESVCGLKVAILKGSIYQQALTDATDKYCVPAGKPAIRIDTYAEGSDSYTAVAAGRADATYIDFAVAKYTAQQFGGKLEVLPTLYPDTPYGAAFTKDNVQLAKAVEAALAQIIRDGSYQKVLDKWGIGQEAVPSAHLQQATS
ncbi:ABC transporter substrate-binding protein [Streptomyces sp. NBC_01320]|uniref:ABC transporter substrate-binding protein n=1 Tax=Streptomyces sp. NBC_01320 TaxID=2903824 RepID=UPI002E151972|nr:ABC transporter substrate-binding protein [Streptomyces sp. NBC_01320]